MFFVHRHRYGQPSEPPIRTVVSLEPFSNTFVVADLPPSSSISCPSRRSRAARRRRYDYAGTSRLRLRPKRNGNEVNRR